MNPNHHKKRNFQKGLAHHIVLKSHYQVFWGKSARRFIDDTLSHYGKHFGIKVYHRALLGNHFHVILLAPSSEALSGFLGVVAGQIAMKLWSAKSAFWKSRPWSRLIHWGKDYGTAIKYIALNYLEGVKAIIRRASSHSQSELKKYEREISEVLHRGLTQIPVPYPAVFAQG